MKELIIGFNDTTNEIVNALGKENIEVDYINARDIDELSSGFQSYDIALMIVNYKYLNEVELASKLLKNVIIKHLLKVITIAYNTYSVKDDIYYNSKAITYTNDIVSAINNINTIISEKNLIGLDINDIFYFSRKNKEFRIITTSSTGNFLSFYEDIKDSKDYILYVEANSLFEIYDIDSTFDLLRVKYQDKTDIVFCSRMLPDKIEEINIKILAF
ncbi:MAG: hypothetical protein IKP77_05650 [Acholeplasmatales bacterium]|nr:hypothetical protein [Acholeplasmatales bacterium]MBR6288571.1 hypothetical protein [Acholeplasmatales bacterium]